ncbi:MAG: 1-acyl-sn-glycerol-3-phosphate acyltransferase [Coriobacteriia bacterium]|nr:1-acyl-sn-glycerol-3-phosphate acyltransferase [Coriobacteriia bacterium]
MTDTTAQKTAKEPHHALFRAHNLTDAGKPGQPKWVLRRLLLLLASGAILPLFRVRVSGAENLPPGPCLISPNHVSYYDGVLLFALTRRFKMPLRLFAKRELYRFRLLGWILDSVGVFPLARKSADRETLTLASRALGAGDWMAVFPEGTRTRGGSSKDQQTAEGAEHVQKLGEASGGAAWLAIRNKVTVVPMAFAGTENIRPVGVRLMRFPPVTIHFGTPLAPDLVVPKDDYSKKERVAALTQLIMDGIAEARTQAQAENAVRTRTFKRAAKHTESSEH